MSDCNSDGDGDGDGISTGCGGGGDGGGASSQGGFWYSDGDCAFAITAAMGQWGGDLESGAAAAGGDGGGEGGAGARGEGGRRRGEGGSAGGVAGRGGVEEGEAEDESWEMVDAPGRWENDHANVSFFIFFFVRKHAFFLYHKDASTNPTYICL